MNLRPPDSGMVSAELSVVLPCYNERDNIQAVHGRLKAVMDQLARRHEIIYVNDGSSDGSDRILERLHAEDPTVKVIHLSRNFGHQAALSAGMAAAQGQAVILMDCDLQDPPEVIPDFIAAWESGAEVVFAVRRNRKEGWLKRIAYSTFYRSMRWISKIDTPLDAGDFCLMDHVVVVAMLRLPERNRFLRGLRAWVGFRQVGVPFDRGMREAGESKYSLRKLAGLALSGYVGFSAMPLRLAGVLGVVSAFAGFALGTWIVILKLSGTSAPQGWASLFSLVLFVCGVQLLVLGTLGEYLGRVYDEVRQRPTYIVRERLGWSDSIPARPPEECVSDGRVRSV
ncbi:MAG TPA: glycosyltransferase family 2 protein [Longimicrobiales bacterium]|nr:glycosyltransferase family 2 protein [Longimicrobiales bacterium]